MMISLKPIIRKDCNKVLIPIILSENSNKFTYFEIEFKKEFKVKHSNEIIGTFSFKEGFKGNKEFEKLKNFFCTEQKKINKKFLFENFSFNINLQRASFYNTTLEPDYNVINTWISLMNNEYTIYGANIN